MWNLHIYIVLERNRGEDDQGEDVKEGTEH